MRCLVLLVGCLLLASSAGAEGLLLRTTLDDAASVATPAVGTGVGAGFATVPADDFVVGQVGNGIRLDANGEFVRYQQTDGARANVELDAGSVEFWYQPAYDHDDGLAYGIFATSATPAGAIRVRKRDASNGNAFSVLVIDAFSSATETAVPSTNYGWSAGQWVKVRVDWDFGVAAGERHVRIFFDGHEAVPTIMGTGPLPMLPESAAQFIYIGSLDGTSDNANGVIDDLRISLPERVPLLPLPVLGGLALLLAAVASAGAVSRAR